MASYAENMALLHELSACEHEFVFVWQFAMRVWHAGHAATMASYERSEIAGFPRYARLKL